jgi:hypothetical protein
MRRTVKHKKINGNNKKRMKRVVFLPQTFDTLSVIAFQL